jgi:autotransporter-associated beta strand protein
LRARLENTSAFNHTLSGNIHVDSSAAGAITEFNSTAGSIKISGDITGSVGTGNSFLIRGTTLGVGGVINGNITLTGGGLTKTDNGTWTIGASGKTYSAPIIGVSAGILKMGADNYLAPTTLLSLGSSFNSIGTFDLNGFSQTVGGITNIGTGVGQTITSSAGTPVLTVDNPSDYSPANTILTGLLGLTKTGSGALTLSGNNDYTGGTYVSGSGALALAHGSAAGSGTINFASTSTSATIPTFSLSGGIDVTNAMTLRADTGRNTIHSLGTNNTLSGNLTITNNAANIVLLSNYAAVGTTFTVGGTTPNSTTITAATFSSSISFRCQTSGALGILNSQINAPNATVDANVNGNWTINSTANSWAVTALSNAGIIKLGANDALATGAVVNLNGTGYLDINGFNQTVAGLAGSGSAGKVVNHSTTSDSILTLAGLTADRNFIGVITDGSNGRITSLVMNSSGRTQTLSGTNTYSGNTAVNAGTLTLSNAPDPLNANAANDASTVTIASTGATLDLTYTGTDKVDKLFIGGAEQVAGIYGKEGSASPIIGIQQITGDGTLTVATGPAGPAGFSSWITGTFANGTIPGGQRGPNDDFDKDGISNLVEYAIAGQDPTVGNAAIGTFTAGTLSFSKRLDATGITYDIESSTQLTAGSWTTLAKPPVVESAGSVSYSFTPGTPVKNFARLKVTTAP